ncbi:MAG TPA: D-2-hydroxyacid dehydrogenase [Propioniciclava sp.]|uniref:D-2-hydroxyacid dehydrogenase n=1 Tax=Propioniciclava sp. TaxID=2038686 RepID=UPI002C49F259|nr:D-2-hydroxyacid dehydrogenase [Propioniciclava sp.]HRL47836.1 D-2-hydroxyacid dehydrogenase [Propioniciclava sp.]
MNPRPTVAMAAPIAPETVALIARLEPRLDLRYDPELLPPMRFPADFSGDPSFRRTPEQQARYDDLVGSSDILYGIPDVDPAALRRAVEANASLRWVQTMAAGGSEQVRRAGLTRADLDRITFTNSSGVHGSALAEFAVFGVLAGAKSLPLLIHQQRERLWSGRWAMGQVSDQTVLVLGLGGIGRQVAAKLSALGARVWGVSQDDTDVAGVTRVLTLDEAIADGADIDAVVTTLPGTPATEGLVGQRLLSALRPGATVVNVGRGTVVDESALLGALDSGRVGCAVLDVFAQEPLPADSPLWTHPGVLVSPHTAALTDSEERRIAELFARNATHFLAGAPMTNRINIVEFY